MYSLPQQSAARIAKPKTEASNNTKSWPKISTRIRRDVSQTKTVFTPNEEVNFLNMCREFFLEGRKPVGLSTSENTRFICQRYILFQSLKKLHWLLFKKNIAFKLLLVTFKFNSIDAHASINISKLLNPNQPTPYLRFSNQNLACNLFLNLTPKSNNTGSSG